MKTGRGVKIALRFLAGGIVSAFFIWLSLRDKDLHAMGRSLEAANWLYVIPYVAILLTIHVLRTVRWGILLEPVGKVPFWRLNRAAAMGFMSLVLLPFRLGELVRPFLVSKRGPPATRSPDIRMSAATASVVIERVADGITTATMLLVTLLVAVPTTVSPHLRTVHLWAWIFLGGFLCILAVLLAIFRLRDRAGTLARRILGRFSPSLAERVGGLLDSFLSGLRLAPHRGKLLLFVLTTIVYWGLNGLGMLLMARAFGLPVGPIEIYAVLGMQVIGVMIPAGPGMVGTFQYFTLLGLSLFVPATLLKGSGAAYANVIWALTFGQQVVLGLVFLFTGHMSLSRLVEVGEETLEGAGEVEAGGA